MFKIQNILIGLTLLSLACQTVSKDPAKNAPSYSLQVVRFDSAFFAIDTLHIKKEVAGLMAKYPNFTEDFFTKILMVNPSKDSNAIKAFYRAYYPIYKDALKTNAMQLEQKNLQEAYKRLHYYFPNYALTHKVITFIGPLESYGNIVAKDALALGLQMYLGANSNWYFSERIQTIYPTYLSRRFTPEYITVNSIQNLVNDITPENTISAPLITQIIEAGKRQYIVNACMPNAPDSILFGYTQLQYANLQKEESKIWTYFLHNKLTYSTNPTDARAIMNEGVYSDLFGEEIPANVGKYLGYKMVEAWMQQHENKGKTMEQLLNEPAEKLFVSAKYNP
jgi:hypothetical protein